MTGIHCHTYIKTTQSYSILYLSLLVRLMTLQIYSTSDHWHHELCKKYAIVLLEILKPMEQKLFTINLQKDKMFKCLEQLSVLNIVILISINLFCNILAHCIFTPHTPHGGYWYFQNPQFNKKKKETPRDGLNFKENLWKLI